MDTNTPDETPPVEGATSEAPAPETTPTPMAQPATDPAPQPPPALATEPVPASEPASADNNSGPDPDGAPVPAPAPDAQSPADKPKTPLDPSLLNNPTRPAGPKPPKSGLGLVIFGTVVVVLALAGLAVYAYLKSR